MTPRSLEILFEDNHLLALNKPPGLPTMGVAAGKPNLVELARQYIKRRDHKPGNVYLGIMSRLDAGTSGVVLLAKTSKAAGRLTEQFRSRRVRKIYWAIVSGRPQPPDGELVDWLIKDEARQRMVIVPADRHRAQEAQLRYSVLRTLAGGTLLEVELLTGRKHQIRVQLAARGWPVWGETKYGRGVPFSPGAFALHARCLTVQHPVQKTPVELVAPAGPAWRELGVE